MVTFSKKQIAEPVRVSQKLRSLRESTGLSIDELAKKTRLQEEYIIAIESHAFHKLPQEAVYQKLFIKRYVIGLGIDPAPYIKQFEEEELKLLSVSEIPSLPKKKKAWLRHRPTIFSFVSSVCILTFFISYFGIQLQKLYEPPSLELTTPDDGIINETGVTTIAGLTDPEVAVFINGEQVRSGNDGAFQANVDLQPGVNTILVSAKKRHGTETNITKYILYRETSQVSFGGLDETLTTH